MSYLSAPAAARDWAVCATTTGAQIRCLSGQMVAAWLAVPLDRTLVVCALIAVVALVLLWRLRERVHDPVVRR